MNNIPPVQPASQKRQPEKESNTPAWLREGISLKMTAKGYYYWEINCYGDINAALIVRMKEIDGALRREFPQNVTELPKQP